MTDPSWMVHRECALCPVTVLDPRAGERCHFGCHPGADCAPEVAS